MSYQFGVRMLNHKVLLVFLSVLPAIVAGQEPSDEATLQRVISMVQAVPAERKDEFKRALADIYANALCPIVPDDRDADYRAIYALTPELSNAVDVPSWELVLDRASELRAKQERIAATMIELNDKDEDFKSIAKRLNEYYSVAARAESIQSLTPHWSHKRSVVLQRIKESRASLPLWPGAKSEWPKVSIDDEFVVPATLFPREELARTFDSLKVIHVALIPRSVAYATVNVAGKLSYVHVLTFEDGDWKILSDMLEVPWYRGSRNAERRSLERLRCATTFTN